MWGEAIRIAIVGFTVVFSGLVMLAIGVKIMSFFCIMANKRAKKAEAARAAAGGA